MSELIEMLFAQAIAAVGVALHGADDAHQRSRTALSIGILTPHHVHAATLGDTTVATVHGRKARQLPRPGPFLGPRSRIPVVAHKRLRDGDVVMVFSDGVTDFVGDWQESVARVAAESPSAGATTSQLLNLAMAGGAGDNVALAVAEAGGRPGHWPLRRAGRRS